MVEQRFALLGASAAVADRHLRAIHDLGGELIAALDPAGMPAGMVDRFPRANGFTQQAAFETYLRREREAGRGADYVVVCTPNHLHVEHTTLGLGLGAHVICEKPLALDPAQLDGLEELERTSGRRVSAILQLRLHPEILRLAASVDPARRSEIELDFVLARGPEFFASWHAHEDRSGGLIMEVGIHFLDLLLALFGAARDVAVQRRSIDRVRGIFELERAGVRWLLSLNADDLPPEKRNADPPFFRRLAVDGEVYDLSKGTGGLHTKLYREVLSGGGYGIPEAGAAIALADGVRRATPLAQEATK